MTNKENQNQQFLSEDFIAEQTVVDFTSTLKELRNTVGPDLVKHREAWRDRSGRLRTVDYVEWHTVADILDEKAPNWSHSIKDIRTIGDYVIVTVAITIDSVTREGIGTGSARSETGIKKAEHDALKRAAVKFGIARNLYKQELEEEKINGELKPVTRTITFDATSSSIGDMITPKQLSMIRAISREKGIDPDSECKAMFDCQIAELSKKAASLLIERLQAIGQEAVEVRKAG
ncbi:MAG TPA: Rad52/Rad22 family DNA repair protein [Pyrinomonadaceae bacterium]|jgi:hypothetical protein|nr:Rad52/Rad22 family DNA repair protein [Pyrinomonadaceae bacterium]